jgi:hypothetical protein
MGWGYLSPLRHRAAAKGLDFAGQAASGTFATPFRADRPLPMVSAEDVGRRAAELLMSNDPSIFRQPRPLQCIDAKAYPCGIVVQRYLPA